MPSFITEFCRYWEKTECPVAPLKWGALSILGHLSGRKIWIKHGAEGHEPFSIFFNIFPVLVGNPGTGKSTAKDFCFDLMTDEFADYKIAGSKTSCEYIIQDMIAKDCEKEFLDKHGVFGIAGGVVKYRPYYALCDELVNFLQTDIKAMSNFLLEMFGCRRNFRTGFKKDSEAGLDQFMQHPYFSLLACATPKGFMDNVGADVAEGGLGRRFVIVHCDKTCDMSQPRFPDDAPAMYMKMVSHLKEIAFAYGEIKYTPGARQFFIFWYENVFAPKRRQLAQDNAHPVLTQFYGSKHIYILKVASLLALAEYPPQFTITEAHLREACALFDEIEPGIIYLTSHTGANPMAAVASQILGSISMSGGMALRQSVIKNFYKSSPHGSRDVDDVLQYLVGTNQLVTQANAIPGDSRTWLFLPAFFKERWLPAQDKGAAAILELVTEVFKRREL